MATVKNVRAAGANTDSDDATVGDSVVDTARTSER